MYSLEEYREKLNRHNNAGLIKYSKTHHLVWDEEGQEYLKIPSNLVDEYIVGEDREE